MNRRATIWAGFLLLQSTLLNNVFAARNDAVADAWRAWQNGDIEQAANKAWDISGSAEAQHLLILSAFVQGDYQSAIQLYNKIDPGYSRIKELNDPILHAWLHLGEYENAARFAREQKMKSWIQQQTALYAANPLSVEIKETSVIPFAEHELTPFFPAFRARINSKERIVHIDTGGSYLMMGPKKAAELGIQTTKGSKGFHGTSRVRLFYGVARSFHLGGATLKNVPVIVLPSLTGAQDLIIFGTNILQQFYSTLDYPNQRLILSPRHETATRKRHDAMLRGIRTEMPFYLWEDHYMYTRGAIGKHRNLNFFVDSGLGYIVPDVTGKPRQAAMLATRKSIASGESIRLCRAINISKSRSLCLWVRYNRINFWWQEQNARHGASSVAFVLMLSSATRFSNSMRGLLISIDEFSYLLAMSNLVEPISYNQSGHTLFCLEKKKEKSWL